MSEKQRIADMLRTVTQMMVDMPDKVSVGIVETPRGVVFRVKVAPSDRDKLIGPGGRTERSLSNVLKVAGMKRKLNAGLDILSETETQEC
jgi:predicted RNA-binding protein YlqC (UPF0109 family)